MGGKLVGRQPTPLEYVFAEAVARLTYGRIEALAEAVRCRSVGGVARADLAAQEHQAGVRAYRNKMVDSVKQ